MFCVTGRLGKPLGTRSAVQMDFCQIAFQPPPLNPLGQLFSPKFSQFFKTAVLNMGMDILTMTVVKHYSLMVFSPRGQILFEQQHFWFQGASLNESLIQLWSFGCYFL